VYTTPIAQAPIISKETDFAARSEVRIVFMVFVLKGKRIVRENVDWLLSPCRTPGRYVDSCNNHPDITKMAPFAGPCNSKTTIRGMKMYGSLAAAKKGPG
jgi:hypothetical protein